MNDFIPVNEPIFTGNERKYTQECIDSGWISSAGPFVKEFEDMTHMRVVLLYEIAELIRFLLDEAQN